MKKIISFLCILCCCCFIYACSGSKKTHGDGLYKIDVKLNDILHISEIADSVRFIRLSDDMLLRDIEKLLVDTAGSMYIQDSKGNGIYKFDRSGKYLYQISKQGQGPGEYVRINDFDIYEGQLLINSDFKQSYYRLDGTFLKDTKEEFSSSVAWVADTICESYGAQSLGVYINGKENRFFKTVFTDDDLLYSHKHHFTKNKNEIYWEDCYNDTIYRISKGNVSPFFHIDFGNLKLPDDIPVDPTIFYNEKVKQYCFDMSGFKVSDDYLSFAFKHSGNFYACIHNRWTSRSYVYKNLINDMDWIAAGFLPLYIQGKTIYFVSDAETVWNQYSLLKNSSEEKHHKMADRFLESVGGTMDETDNPYIVAVACK